MREDEAYKITFTPYAYKNVTRESRKENFLVQPLAFSKEAWEKSRCRGTLDVKRY